MNEAQRKAFDSGREAKEQGKGMDAMPSGYRASKSLKRFWRDGYDSARTATDVSYQEPPITVTVHTSAVNQYLPIHIPLPEYYIKHPAIACRNCRCLYMADGGKAVVVSTTSVGMAYLRCKACSKGFRLPVR